MATRGPKQAYGVASITKLLGGVDFPLSKQEILKAYGNSTINWTKNQNFVLKDLLKSVKTEQFLSAADLASAIAKEIKKA